MSSVELSCAGPTEYLCQNEMILSITKEWASSNVSICAECHSQGRQVKGQKGIFPEVSGRGLTTGTRGAVAGSSARHRAACGRLDELDVLAEDARFV